MKRVLIVTFLAFSLIFVLAGCSSNQTTGGTENNGNTSANDSGKTFYMLSDLEAAFGDDVANFDEKQLEGYKADSFKMIVKDFMIAEVKYVKDNNEIVVRTGDTAEGNISDISTDGLTVKDYTSNGVAVKYALVNNDTYVAYWTQGDYSYSLYETEEMEETYFKVLIDDLTSSINADEAANKTADTTDTAN